MNKQVIIVENYFDHFNLILPEIKKIKLYSQKEFNKKYTDQIQTWPGQRSGDLCLENPILLAYALSYFNKFNINVKNVKVFSYIHFRGEDQINKDWIHKDHCTYSMLIYLNSTNLNSGTYLYDENNNMITDIKYVQNRAVLYNGSYNHMGVWSFWKVS
jgi:hypothetical protein